MKKNTILVSAFIMMLAATVTAQTIPNAGFENWTNQGSYEEPDDWNTSNQLYGMFPGGVGVVKSTDSYSGSYAIEVSSPLVSSTLYAGIATLGSIDTLSKGGIPNTTVGGSLSGYYKYSASGSTDSALVVAYFTRLLGQTVETRFIARAALPPASSYTYFEAPVLFVEDTISITPEKLNIVIFSCDSVANPHQGTLLVDDLAFKGALSVESLQSEKIQLNVYPNPATDHLTIENKSDYYIENIRLFTLEGKQADAAVPSAGQTINTLNISHLPEGPYICWIELSDGNTYFQRITVIR